MQNDEKKILLDLFFKESESVEEIIFKGNSYTKVVVQKKRKYFMY